MKPRARAPSHCCARDRSAPREPETIDWASVGADYVVESTGVFTTVDKVGGRAGRARARGTRGPRAEGLLALWGTHSACAHASAAAALLTAAAPQPAPAPRIPRRPRPRQP
jgi:hypothetical protein